VKELDRPAPPPFPPPDRGSSGARRWVIRGLIPLLVVTWLLGTWLYVNHRDSELFGDKTFIAAANAACAGSKTKIDEQQRPGEDATSEERAASVERVAGILSDMARSLRALPVAAADAPAVSRWLDELDRFVAVGPRYAAAIRSGDERHAEDIGNEGDSPNHRFNVTARANGIDRCVLG
jgi:hypothetical protein